MDPNSLRGLRMLLLAAPLAAGCGPDAKPGSAAVPGVSQLAPGDATAAPARSAAAADSLSYAVPHDVSGNGTTLATLQHDFDEFSWQSFVALNWPAAGVGLPDTSVVIGQNGDAPAVWESYKEPYEVFLHDGGRPPPWGSPRDIPAACRSLGAAAGTPVLNMTQKAPPEVLNAMGQPFRTGPLVDQDSNYVRFGIYMNRDSYDYLVSNTLYNQPGQAAFTQPLAFPSGNTQNDTVGGIVIKSAWRVMTARDPQGRYHTAKVLVYTPPSTAPRVPESCALQTVGLVGFHVAHKTQSSPQWAWSTFEQVDNLQVPAGSGLHASFNNPACTTCTPNAPPTGPWNPNVKTKPTQVVRDIPIDSATQALNAKWQARLRGVNVQSPWQFYELVSTQWPTNPPGSPTGNPAPQFLANTTLETYVQGKVPNVSSSCIMCHNNATTTASRPSDFSYMLELAQAVHSTPATGGQR
jgi:hypothetical protein